MRAKGSAFTRSRDRNAGSSAKGMDAVDAMPLLRGLLKTGGGVKALPAVFVLAFLFAPVSFAQAADSYPDLSGTWIDNSNSEQKITIVEKGDTIKIHESDGDKVIANYTCNLNGQQCNFREDGRPAKVMLYYNGPKLIEIKERGKDTEKRRFSLSQDGKTMKVEVISLSSDDKVNSTQTYQKQAS